MNRMLVCFGLLASILGCTDKNPFDVPEAQLPIIEVLEGEFTLVTDGAPGERLAGPIPYRISNPLDVELHVLVSCLTIVMERLEGDRWKKGWANRGCHLGDYQTASIEPGGVFAADYHVARYATLSPGTYRLRIDDIGLEPLDDLEPPRAAAQAPLSMRVSTRFELR